MTIQPAVPGTLDDNDNIRVLAYRMSALETAFSGFGEKLDKVIAHYPTSATLELILNPMRTDLKELKEKHEEEQREKAKHQQQIKYLIAASIVSPLGILAVGAFTKGM